MKYEKYKLYQLINSFDDYGNSKHDFELIAEIELYLNEQHLKTDGTDSRYFIKAFQAVTTYSSFELGEEYKIANSQHEFAVESFINGRLTQLVLREVEQ